LGAGRAQAATDLISLNAQRVFTIFSVGSLLIVVDATVGCSRCAVSQHRGRLYSIVTIFVTSCTIDAIMQG
jgi:uncharacterized membrane-anchored protein YitT (DUF2179 family)